MLKQYLGLLICMGLIGLVISQPQEDLIDKSKITMFPTGYNHDIYGGYLNITYDTKAFYYFFYESQHSPSSDPVILWLNGGPGCSSLSGMVTQIGPFRFKENSDKMYINQYAWNLKANLLFLESPSGVGFSVGSKDQLVTNDTQTARDNLIAVIKFFERFPSMKYLDFYIAGQSYAGVYIPQLAQAILDYNDGVHDQRINLKGILLGNACTHKTQTECFTGQWSRYQNQFLYTRAFIDEKDYQILEADCVMNENSDVCIKDKMKLKSDFFATGANVYNIYAKCYNTTNSTLLLNDKISTIIRDKINRYQQKDLSHTLRCSDALGAIKLFNTDDYREHLHIGLLSQQLPWTPCSDKLTYTSQQHPYTILPTLMKAGLRIFYFSGDTDAMVPIQGTLYWLQQFRISYGMSIKKHWRPWVSLNQNISGMVWELQGITFASFRGAGHMVPTDKPAQAYEMLEVFLGNKNWSQPHDYYQLTTQ